MAPPERCAEVESRLTEALLDRSEPEAGDRAHAEDCATCGPLLLEITELGDQLERLGDVLDAPDRLTDATILRVRSLMERERLGDRVPMRVPAGLPKGFPGECLRLLGAALLPFPIVVAWNLAFLALGEQVLGNVLPASLLSTVGAAYVAAAAGWFALLYGSIPILAHRRAQRRTAEVSS